MPLIPKVGRKSFKMRLLVATIYGVLSLGAVTMVYPFLLMLSTSITSSTDTNEFRVIPRYLLHEEALFAKYVDDKYSGDIERINAAYHTDFKKNENLAPPPKPLTEQERAFAQAWQEFTHTLPLSFKETGFRGYGSHPSRLALAYRDYTRALFHNDIAALNRAYTEENENFETVNPPIERPTKQNWSPDTSRKMQDYLAWKATLPEEMRLVVGAEPLFDKYLKEDAEEYGGDLGKTCAVWGPHASFDTVPLPATPPTDPKQRHDWERFVRGHLPFRYLAVSPGAVTPYRDFLRKRYPTLAKLNAAYGTRYDSFDVISLPERLPDGGLIVLDWGEFVAKALPLDAMRVDSPETRFRDALQQKFGTVEAINQKFGLNVASVNAIQPPYYLADALTVHESAPDLRRDFATRNYRQVLSYILLHGQALWVTVLFCLATILTTLTVNPLCAYALSRYNLPYAYKILLFLLATMAFPAEVAMIPNFLLLKEFGMLNTYYALILPGVASGFSIFLLKGFFDSLPKELYEAGTIDGAGETRMFWQITLPLSKPIFAVIALQAFTAAYGAFMFALLVCQDSRMWTLMVWLYQLQINSPQYIMMAALTVAAIPTLLVFVFAQNVILRGIILPSEK